jgi:TolA-binding protein
MPLAPATLQSYFRRMKSFCRITALCLLCAAPLSRAQDAATAAAAATRQEAEENYNTLKGHVDDLIAAQEAQAKEILSLRKEIAELRVQISQPSSNYASAEALKRLADAVEELDKQRKADMALIMETIHAAAAAPISHGGTPKPPPADHGTPGVNADQSGFYYIVKKDDSIGLIAQGYRDQGIKVTSKEIEDANPNINPAKLRVGMKIFIPAKEPAAKP